MLRRRLRAHGALALLLAALGCSSRSAGPCCGGPGQPSATTSGVTAPASAGGAASFCAACQPRRQTGAAQSPDVRETSGIAASALHPGVFYVHNDSGDTARFFAIDAQGRDQGTFELTGATAVDWEDVARGPCAAAPAGGSCLYFSDTGDNDHDRSSYVIYRVPEPTSLGAGKHAVTAEALPFTYPDGGHNAEALLIHPKTGVITLVTKVKKKGTRAASIYELPLPLTPGRPAVAVKKGEIEPPTEDKRLTGGAVHPEARGVLLRNHSQVLHFPMRPEQSVAEALLAAPCVFPPDAVKGEAITWLPSGDGFVTMSEGAGAALEETRCPAAP
ncbi:MAG: hypothetical protein U0359_13365 [Byssovorax sp.]